jgi:ATP-dependent DNA ligase
MEVKIMIPETIQFDLHPLDPNFVPPKPQKKVADHTLQNLFDTNKAIPTRKRDGYAAIVTKTKSGIELYSRSVNNLTERFPHLIEDLLGLVIANDTLICGELVVEIDDRDNLDYLSAVAMSSLEGAKRLQLKNPVQFMPYNVLVHKNKDLSYLRNEDRFEILDEIFDSAPTDYILPFESFTNSFEELKKLVVANKWEGLVIYNRDSRSGYRLDNDYAHPYRPPGTYKWKPPE